MGQTTLFLDGKDIPDAATLDELVRRGVSIEPQAASSLEGEDGVPINIVFGNDKCGSVEALFNAAPSRGGREPAEAHAQLC